MKYRPPLGLSRPLDPKRAVVIAADRERGPHARRPRDVLPAVDPSTKRCQASGIRELHAGTGTCAAAPATLFASTPWAGRWRRAAGAAIPSRAPPPGSSFLPSSCRLERVRLHTALE